MANPLFRRADGLGKLERFFLRAAQEVVGKPLSRLDADSWKAAERRNHTINGVGKAGPGHRQLPLSPEAPPRSGKRPAGSPPVTEASDLGRRVSRLGEPSVDGRHHQVFEQLGVAIGHQLGVDMNRDHLEPAANLDGHRAAAGITFHFDLAERFNRITQLAGVLDQFRKHSQLIEHGVVCPSRGLDFRFVSPARTVQARKSIFEAALLRAACQFSEEMSSSP